MSWYLKIKWRKHIIDLGLSFIKKSQERMISFLNNLQCSEGNKVFTIKKEHTWLQTQISEWDEENSAEEHL